MTPLERRAYQREYMRQWRLDNPDKIRASRKAFIARHGYPHWKQATKPRSETCEICGDPANTFFDHCHCCEQFRGWLCGDCNSVLGFIHDDPDRLEGIREYLEAHSSVCKGVIVSTGGQAAAEQSTLPMAFLPDSV
jgi:hypothetical protein